MMALSPRIAKSLDTLRSQVNAQWPKRSKSSDGWIGDTAHSQRKSDHNPNTAGVVQAFDITHDPKSGPDAGKLADALLASRDARIKYVISNRRIGSSYVSGGRPAWAWGPYTGTNAHEHHCHVSVRDDAASYDDIKPWRLDMLGTPPPASPPSTAVDATTQRLKMGRMIMGYETALPLHMYVVADGTREIAGVNERYHPDKFLELKDLLAKGEQQQAQDVVAKYVVDYTAICATWTENADVEFYLRDCAFNRGPTGAAKILQKAVGVAVDGAVGPNTLRGVKAMAPDQLLQRLRLKREEYEREKYGRKEGDKLWAGLVNRWNKALTDAAQFKGMKLDSAVIAAGGGTVIAGGGAIAVAVKEKKADWTTVIPIVVIVLGLAILAVALLKRKK